MLCSQSTAILISAGPFERDPVSNQVYFRLNNSFRQLMSESVNVHQLAVNEGNTSFLWHSKIVLDTKGRKPDTYSACET